MLAYLLLILVLLAFILILLIQKMDISSLPNEMLTDVLKYIEFNTIIRIRKMNERMDELAKRADIGLKMPVKILSCYDPYVDIDGIKKFPITRIGTADDVIYRTCTVALSSALANTKPGEIYILNWGVTDELIEVMKQHPASLRYVKSIKFESNSFYATKENARYLVEELSPKLETLLRSIGGDKLQNLCNAEVLGSRQWKDLYICTLKLPHKEEYQYKLDDKFLLQVAPKCRSFRTNYYQNFTIRGGLNLVKKCQQESDLDHVFNLDTIDRGDILPSFIEELFKNNVKGAIVIKWYEPINVCCFQITCTHAGPTISLTFKVAETTPDLKQFNNN